MKSVRPSAGCRVGLVTRWFAFVSISSACALGQESAPKPADQKPPTTQHVLTSRTGASVTVAPSGGLNHVAPETQVPSRVRGASTDQSVIDKTGQVAASKGESVGFTLFPFTFSPLMPYLDSTIMFGNTCLQPGALIEEDALSNGAQATKTWLSSYGLEYVLQQAYLLSGSADRVSGDSPINAYSFRFLGDWKVIRDTDFNGWVSLGVNGGSGLGVDWEDQSPATNIGASTSVWGGWYGVDGWIDELAWGMSFDGGRLAVMAGVMDQGNYFDENTFANSAYGQLLNGIFVNSAVYPIPGNNPGINVQWQPTHSFYLMAGAGSTNQEPGDPPFEELSTRDMAYLLELGFIDPDSFDLGRGVLRVQPFAASFEGDDGVGLCLNVEQQLGKTSPFGAFGRFGACDESVAPIGGASAEAAVGIVAVGPFAAHGASLAGNNDYLGLGGAWTRVAESGHDEYAVELSYAIQVTPTIIVQPDLQLVVDPANNPDQDVATVFQLQVTMTW